MKSQKEQLNQFPQITGLDLIGAKFQSIQNGSCITGLDLIGARTEQMPTDMITGLDLIGA
jgi:hypothetical protein